MRPGRKDDLTITPVGRNFAKDPGCVASEASKLSSSDASGSVPRATAPGGLEEQCRLGWPVKSYGLAAISLARHSAGLRRLTSEDFAELFDRLCELLEVSNNQKPPHGQ